MISKKKFKHLPKKIMAYALSAAMVLTLAPSFGTAAPKVSAAGSVKVKGNVNLGSYVIKDTTDSLSYSFGAPEVNLTDKSGKLTVLSITVDSGYFVLADGKTSLTGTNVKGQGSLAEVSEGTSTYAESLEAGTKYKSVSFTGKDIEPASVKNFISSIKFTQSEDPSSKASKRVGIPQTVSAAVSDADIGNKSARVDENGVLHYYEYVPFDSSTVPDESTWTNSYKNAKKNVFMGMKGYLATITSQEEHDFVYKNATKSDGTKANGAQGWIGATRMTNDGSGAASIADAKVSSPGDDAETYSVPSDIASENGGYPGDDNIPKDGQKYSDLYTWYWVDGPEAGTPFYYGSTTEDMLYSISRSDIAAFNEANKNYHNWADDNGVQPDNNHGSADRWSNNEMFVTYGFSTKGKWNDWANWSTSPIKSPTNNNNEYTSNGYYIEWSPYEKGMADGSGSGSDTTPIIQDTKTVDLTEGKNTGMLSIQVINTTSGKAEKEETKYNGQDELKNPDTNTSTSPYKYDLTTTDDGSVDSDKAILVVTQRLTGDTVSVEKADGTPVTPDSEEGYNYTVDLEKGNNIFKITAKDSAGKTYDYYVNIKRDSSDTKNDKADVTPGAENPDGTDLDEKPITKNDSSSPEDAKVVNVTVSIPWNLESVVLTADDISENADIEVSKDLETAEGYEDITSDSTKLISYGKITLSDIKNNTSGEVADGIAKISVKVTSEDGKKTTTVNYIVNQGAKPPVDTEFKVTPSEPEGEPTPEPVNDPESKNTATDKYVVITVDPAQDEITLTPSFGEGAKTVTVSKEDGPDNAKVDKEGPVNSGDSQKVTGLENDKDTVVKYVVTDKNGDVVNYHYTIKRPEEEKSSDADVTPGARNTDDTAILPSPDVKSDDSVPSYVKKTVNIEIPYDATSVRLVAGDIDPSADAAVSDPAAETGFQGLKKQGDASVKENGYFDITDIPVNTDKVTTPVGKVVLTVTSEDGKNKTTVTYNISKSKAPLSDDTTVTPGAEKADPADPDPDVAPGTEDNTDPQNIKQEVTVTLDWNVDSVDLKADGIADEAAVDKLTLTPANESGAKTDDTKDTVKTDGKIRITGIKDNTGSEPSDAATVELVVKAENGDTKTVTYRIVKNPKPDTEFKVTPSDPEGETIPESTDDPEGKNTATDKYVVITVDPEQEKITLTPSFGKDAKTVTVSKEDGPDGAKVNDEGTVTNGTGQTVTGLDQDKDTVVKYVVTDKNGDVVNYHYTIRRPKSSDAPVVPGASETKNDGTDEPLTPENTAAPQTTTGPDGVTTTTYERTYTIPYNQDNINLEYGDAAEKAGATVQTTDKKDFTDKAADVADPGSGKVKVTKIPVNNSTTEDVTYRTVVTVTSQDGKTVNKIIYNVIQEKKPTADGDVVVPTASPDATPVPEDEKPSIDKPVVVDNDTNTEKTKVYTIKVGNKVTETAFSIIPDQRDAEVGDFIYAGPGSASDVTAVKSENSNNVNYLVKGLSTQENTVIRVDSVSKDNKEKVHYVVTIVREKSDDASISNVFDDGDKGGKLTQDKEAGGESGSAVHERVITVPNDVTNYDFQLNLNKNTAGYVDGSDVDKSDNVALTSEKDPETGLTKINIKASDLKVGDDSTSVTFKTVAENGYTETYRYRIVRLPAEDTKATETPAAPENSGAPAGTAVPATGSAVPATTPGVSTQTAVDPKAPVKFSLDGQTVTMDPNSRFDISKYVTNLQNAQEVIYHCCAHSIIAIDKDGKVTAMRKGKSYVHVLVKQNNKWSDYTFRLVSTQATGIQAYGQIFTVGGLKYEVTTGTSVRVASLNYKTKKKSVKIPDSITVSGTKYNVTGIAPYAFLQNLKVKKITIGANVKDIGSTAFAGMHNLKQFKVSKKNKYIKSYTKGNYKHMIVSKNGKTLMAMAGTRGKVTIPKTVTRVNEYAACGNRCTTLIFPAGLKRLDPCAFAHDGKLVNVVFKGNKVPQMPHNCSLDKMNYKKGNVYVKPSLIKKFRSKFKSAVARKQFPALSHVKSIKVYNAKVKKAKSASKKKSSKKSSKKKK